MKDFYKVVFADATCEQQFERAFIPIIPMGDDPNEVRHSYIWLRSTDHAAWSSMGFSVNESNLAYQGYIWESDLCPTHFLGNRGWRRMHEIILNVGLKSGFRTVSKTPDHAKLNQRLQDFLSSHTAKIVEQNGEMVWMLASQ
ncbi:MAG: hypothetical protein WA154_14675 [Moraxellaceae bacterium]